MRPGDLLTNGAIVIDSQRLGENQDYVVLALRPHPMHPYVVWNCDESGEAYRGDYCSTIYEAIGCFDFRSLRNSTFGAFND